MQVNNFLPPPGPSLLTIMLNVWAAVGPLVGIFIGSWLTRSQQRRQWLAENKVKEWQEMMGTITSSLTTLAKSGADRHNPEFIKERVDAIVAGTEVISNRVFIIRESRRRRIFEMWTDALAEFEKDNDVVALGSRCGEIKFQIEDGAREDISKI